MVALTEWYLHDATFSGSGTYPGATSQSATSPGVTVSGASTNRTMDGTKGTGAQTLVAGASLAQTATQNIWFRRFISPPLAAQTIPAGTGLTGIAGGFLVSNSNASGVFPSYPVVYIWRPSTGAIVGKLLDTVTAGGSVGVGTSETWNISGFQNTSALAILDGDVLVCELWMHGTQGMATSYNWSVGYGSTTEYPNTTGGAITTPATALFTPSITLYAPTPISDTDVNGTTTESATVQTPTPISGADTDGAITESASITKIVLATVADAGAISESASVVAKVPGTDTNAAATESAQFASHTGDTDGNGATTESASYVLGNTQIVVYEPDKVSSYNLLNASVSSYNAIPIRYSTYNAIPQSSIPLPNLVESVAVTIPVAAFDGNGTVTEATQLVYPGAASADVATGTDTATVVVKVSSADTNGTTTETAAYVYPLTSADAGIGSDTQVLQAGATVSGVDTGLGLSEVASVGKALIPAADSATLVESTTLVSQISASDTNAGITESAGDQTYATDSGTGTDVVTLTAQIPVADAGAGADTGTLQTQNFKTDTDTGTGTETASTIIGLITATDAGSTAEVPVLKALLISADVGSGADQSQIPTSLYFAADAATGIDNGIVQVLLTVLDSGIATETNGFGFTVSEVFVGLDFAALWSQVFDSDAGTISEQGAHYPPTILGALKSGKITRGLDGSLVRLGSRGDVQSRDFIVLKKGTVRGLAGDVETTVTGRVE